MRRDGLTYQKVSAEWVLNLEEDDMPDTNVKSNVRLEAIGTDGSISSSFNPDVVEMGEMMNKVSDHSDPRTLVAISAVVTQGDDTISIFVL